MPGKSIRRSLTEVIRSLPLQAVAEKLGLIVEVRGSVKKALCPFHSDAKPSLVIFDAGNYPHFHCFACGAHGDALHLVKGVLQCSFAEATKWLDSAFSTRLARKASQSDTLAELPDAYRAALDAYKRFNGLDEVLRWADLRGISRQMVKDAEICYATPATLTRHLQSEIERGGDWRPLQAAYEEAGLLQPMRTVERSGELFPDVASRLRDFFREPRVILPLKNSEGRVVGLAGRRIAPDEATESPKYLYTPGFPRSDVLYREDVVLRALQRRSNGKDGEPINVFVCEGLLDALRLESFGALAVSILGAQVSTRQVEEIVRLTTTVPAAVAVRVQVFLDRDLAGIRGAAKLLTSLASQGVESSYVWPPGSSLTQIGVTGADSKDPDSIFRRVTPSVAIDLALSWRHPPALAPLTLSLGAQTTPDEVIDDPRWDQMSLSRRYHAAVRLSREPTVAEFLLSSDASGQPYLAHWYGDTLRFRARVTPNGDQSVRAARSSLFIEDTNARLNIARALAKSGAERGEVPCDQAAWARVDSGSTAYNIGLVERLRLDDFRPMEPLDAVLVSRGFDKDEPRLKAMPSPEDLVLQQYMMGELLSERFDDPAELRQFSSHIPAVRFYREASLTETTAEDLTYTRHQETLSFAYQIDMDVLEGRRTASNQGMYRPYIECWRDFIRTLRRKSDEFGEVYVLRLDVRRYYDRLTRTTVRDSLRRPLFDAFDVLKDSDKQAQLAPAFTDRANIAESFADWLCDQSFDFQYFHPSSGEIVNSPRGIGIPQGPVLSAWLATVALFPLDAGLRDHLNKINGLGDTRRRVAYARYVDDIFLMATAPDLLQQLRAVAEDAAKSLRLELVQKGDHIPHMTAAAFATLLAEGKAVVASGPARDMGLLHLGDGEAGYETWSEADLTRASSLDLLSDRRLYTVDTETLEDQLYTALRASDLRPAELPKAARWIWYAVAGRHLSTATDAWRQFWAIWARVAQGTDWTLKPDDRPWDDPALYALDGLERLLISSNILDKNLTQQVDEVRRSRLKSLARLAVQPDFYNIILQAAAGGPSSSGRGARSLPRMFIQRCVSLRWISSQLAGVVLDRSFKDQYEQLMGRTSHQLSASLTRAWLADVEISNGSLYALADEGGTPLERSTLWPQFLWLHKAIVLLGKKHVGDDDVLQEIAGELKVLLALSPAPPLSSAKRLLDLLALWLPEYDVGGEGPISEAFSTLLAVCHIDNLTQCLARRAALLQKSVGGHVLPLPPGLSSKEVLLTLPPPQKGQTDPATFESIIKIEIARHAQGRQQSVPMMVANRRHADGIVDDWKPYRPETLAGTPLQARKTDWLGEPRHYFSQPPLARTEVVPEMLRWTASAFEALARLNGSSLLSVPNEEGDSYEYVAAWAYLAFSSAPDTSLPSQEALTVSLIGPLALRSSLGNVAFARDGRGRLKTYEVPLADAWLWRLGYLVTDVLGLSSELDRYQEVQSDQRESFLAAEFVLRSMLRRLRGEFAPAIPLPRHTTDSHLPATLVRSLRLLRDFPTDAAQGSQLAYALSIETESRAMERRLKDQWDPTKRGQAASFLESVARGVLFRLPIAWAMELPGPSIDNAATGDMRRGVAAWYALEDRISQLPTSDKSGTAASTERVAWNALRDGIRCAVISTWIRLLVMELETDGRYPRPLQSPAPEEWGLDDWTAELENGEGDAAVAFNEALSSEMAHRRLTALSPLGWLALLAHRLNVYEVADRKIQIDLSVLRELAPRITRLARLLSGSAADSELMAEWPFDIVGLASTVFDELSYQDAILTLRSIDSVVGFSVSTVTSDVWGLNPRTKQFVDSRGRAWRLTRTLVDQLGRDKHVEEHGTGRSLNRVWTETRNAEGDLVGVSVLGASFAALASVEKTGDSEDILLDDHFEPSPLSDVSHLPPAATSVLPPAAASMDKDDKVEPPSGTASDSPSVVGPESVGTKTAATPEKRGSPDLDRIGLLYTRLQRTQHQEWRSREAKSPHHIRIGLFQFRVDDSYAHPVVEAGAHPLIPVPFSTLVAAKLRDAKKAQKRGSEHHWNQAATLPSWVEHRRRKLLSEAVATCESFGTEVLVLPEYSVRPDTIVWLRGHLRRVGAKVAVIAGTYRLHGSSADLHFPKDFEDLAPDPSQLSEFKEKSALITLLQPLKLLDGTELVALFSRMKKYPSVAMGEVIHPPNTTWFPLLELERLVGYVNAMRRGESKPELDYRETLALAKECLPTERLAELICSELFASTHPVNWDAIDQEYRRLRVRFGYSVGPESAVSVDTTKFVERLSALPRQRDRRTIIVVPAYTTRSADYWIYGQSALLAAGLTTVFCAAVTKNAKGGGSCFIGKSSWADEEHAAGFVVPTTPYCGWSRGIYYNKPADALGEGEQALVIADVDPVYMNEGKPRPQTLPVPIQLVAHLPVIESVLSTSDASELEKHRMVKHDVIVQKAFTVLDNVSIGRNSLLDPARTLASGKSAFLWASELTSFFGRHSGWSARLAAWNENWRELPFYGTPPALTDWLLVDLTPTEPLPTIYVPPWGSDDGSATLADA